MSTMLTSKKKGVSLVEILVSIFLISSMSLLMAQLTSSSIKTYKVTQLTNKYSEDMAKIIRDFEFTTRAGINISIAKADELEFLRYYALEEESLYPDKVRYFLENKDGNYQFKIGIAEFDELDENNQATYKEENIRLIVSDVKYNEDKPLFNYFDKNDDQIPFDNTTGSITKGIFIQSIQLNIYLGGNPVDPNKIMTQTTKIKFRNLNAL